MFLLYSVMDENFSWYRDSNINMFTNGSVDKTDEDFVESNLMRCKISMKQCRQILNDMNIL